MLCSILVVLSFLFFLWIYVLLIFKTNVSFAQMYCGFIWCVEFNIMRKYTTINHCKSTVPEKSSEEYHLVQRHYSCRYNMSVILRWVVSWSTEEFQKHVAMNNWPAASHWQWLSQNVLSRFEYTTTSSEYHMFVIIDPNASVSPDYLYNSYMCQSLYFLTNFGNKDL